MDKIIIYSDGGSRGNPGPAAIYEFNPLDEDTLYFDSAPSLFLGSIKGVTGIMAWEFK